MMKEWMRRFLRQTSLAGACLSLILLLAEWLVPGSVLPYFNILWLAVGSVVLTLIVR